MPSTSTAKKRAASSRPTWSKVQSPKSKVQSPKPRTQNSKLKTQNSKLKTQELPAHLRREMAALVILVVGALSMLGLFTWSRGGQGIIGVLGGTLAQMFGIVAWLVPVSLIMAGGALVIGARSDVRWLSPLVPFGLAAMLLGLMGFIHLFADGQPAAEAGQGGGYLGLAISTLLSNYLTKAGAGVVLFALTLAGFMLAFGVSIGQLVRGVGRPTVAAGKMAGKALGEASTEVSRLMSERTARQQFNEPIHINGQHVLDDEDSLSLPLLDAMPETAVFPSKRMFPQDNPQPHSAPTEIVNLLGDTAKSNGKEKPAPIINISSLQNSKLKTMPLNEVKGQNSELEVLVPSPLGYIWNLPSLNLLETGSETKVSQTDLKSKIKVIEETLQSFNVEATVREVNTGPAVTQFAIEPGVGVRVSRITALEKDLALALAAPDIRLEAPIPGQSRIGVEVPNVSLQVVGLRDIMEVDAFRTNKGRLKIALGRDTHGQPVVTDLAKLPHILVAGATGSGKSVFLNSMIMGFLLQFTPDDLRMLMIDPKRVELTGFNGIPHLLRPVVTDVRMEKDHQSKVRDPKPKDENERERPLTAVEALKWALWEMERRYKLFARGQRDKDGASKVFRNIEQYRTFKKENPETSMEHLPYIVIIIDELADLMLTAPEEVETSLCRLAQLARATGIHLVVATQRPSVDVVTGLIKANFPARAAFAVTSQVDSKVILDSGGAEKLLGRGDMLYTASDESKPVRIQGTFVSDAEADKVVNSWRKQLPSAQELADNGVNTVVQPMPMPDWLGTGNADEDSELLEQAIELVKRNRYVSVSMLQRKLRVGYNRAARLVEQMEEMGLISPAQGDNRGKPREVLLGAPDNRGIDPPPEDIEAHEE